MKFCFCRYCGNKIFLDDEQQVITINKNVHVEHTNIRIDEAKLTHEYYKDKKEKRELIVGLCGGLLAILLFLSFILYFPISEKIAASAGKISAGYYADLIGQDYKSVVAHFESAGFENIEVIDLDDSGILFWKEGKVEAISVAGDTDFESHNYFQPDAKVVISHH